MLEAYNSLNNDDRDSNSMNIYSDNGQNSIEKTLEVQKILGVKLPQSYLNLVLKHDALRLENDIFDFKNVYGELDERDICFLSIHENHINGGILGEQDNVNDLENYGIKDLIIFGICANGDYVCFDYRANPKSSEPKVVLIYHDDLIDHEDGTSSMVINYVAENFDNFLNMLHD